jgi:hypothetical protein
VELWSDVRRLGSEYRAKNSLQIAADGFFQTVLPGDLENSGSAIDCMNATPQRRWLQFSLKLLLIAVTALCVWLGVLANRAANQRRAAEALTRAGGKVYYDYQRIPGTFDPDAPLPISPWLGRILGEDLFRSVVHVSLESVSDTDECLKWLPNLPTLEELMVDTSPMDLAEGHYQGWVRQDLALKGKPATEQGLQHLKHLNNLRELGIAGAQLSGSELRHIAHLHRLERLCIIRTTISDQALSHLAELAGLKDLMLSYTTIGDPGLVHLKGLSDLEKLNLEYTFITDRGLEYLAGLRNLKDLRIAHNDISDAGLIHLQDLSQLEWLSIEDTRVTDAGLAHLRNLDSLQCLIAWGTRIGDAGLVWLHKLPLQLVNLRGTLITDEGLAGLSAIAALQMVQVNVTPIPNVADAARYVRYGIVTQPRITPAGMKALQEKLPNCRVAP